MNDAIKEYTGVDFLSFKGDTDKAKEVAKELGLVPKKLICGVTLCRSHLKRR